MIDNITIRQDELIHLRPLPVKFCLLPRASFQPSFRKPEFKISMNMSVIGSPEFCRRTDINLMSKVDADPHGICFQLMLWSNVFALLPLNHIHPGRFGSDPHIHVFGKKFTRAETCSFAFFARRRRSSQRLQMPRPGFAFCQTVSSNGSSPSSSV